MFATIQGKVGYLRGNYAVIECAGIGYKVFVTAYTLGKLASLSEAKFFLHTYVREDALALYGFLQLSELEMFELLLSISGIGPKAALGILTIADPKTIRTAILNEDASILTRVSGVGKKTAERVILELKNKVANLSEEEKEKTLADTDALEALVAMGYSVAEAREALKGIGASITDMSERVRAALKILAR